MIELFTAAAMLVSSVYGQASTTAPSADLTASTSAYVVASTTPVAASSTDPIKDVRAYVESAYADQPILAGIARCESQFRQYDKDGNVLHGKVNPADVGVMQINEKYHLDEATAMGLNLETVAGNVAYAKHLFETQGAEAWSASEKCWSKPIAFATPAN